MLMMRALKKCWFSVEMSFGAALTCGPGQNVNQIGGAASLAWLPAGWSRSPGSVLPISSILTTNKMPSLPAPAIKPRSSISTGPPEPRSMSSHPALSFIA